MFMEALSAWTPIGLRLRGSSPVSYLPTSYRLERGKKPLHDIITRRLWVLFLLYLLYLVAGDEERVLGYLHHRGVVDGIGIEIVDHCVRIHLLEQLDLSAAEAEVGYVRVAVGARADVVPDVESVHNVVEQNLGAR